MLLGDTVAALPGGVLRGLDLLAAFAAQDANEAANCVRLPALTGIRIAARIAPRLYIKTQTKVPTRE